MTSTLIRHCWREALEAALELDDLAKADELLASVDDLRPGELTPSLDAHRKRFHARLDARRGDHDDVEDNFRNAEVLFAEHEFAFHLAVTRLEHAEWLAGQGRSDETEPLLAEARDTFDRLGASPWLRRVDALPSPPAVGSDQREQVSRLPVTADLAGLD